MQKFYPTRRLGLHLGGRSAARLRPNQPGGCLYNILPYIEQEPLWRLPDDGDPLNITAQQKASAAVMCQTPLAVMNCPSRRPAQLYPYILGSYWDPELQRHDDRRSQRLRRQRGRQPGSEANRAT